MHTGIDRRGNYVYPVMPFDRYTKVTREDQRFALTLYSQIRQPGGEAHADGALKISATSAPASGN